MFMFIFVRLRNCFTKLIAVPGFGVVQIVFSLNRCRITGRMALIGEFSQGLKADVPISICTLLTNKTLHFVIGARV